jgi:hypothetical protein
MPYSQLANWIEERNEAITWRWIESVRREPRIQSDSELSDDSLRDHIPAVIDEICGLLRQCGQPTIINTREARVHAYVRFRQGYRARELVRELSLLRVTLLDHIGELLMSGTAAITVEKYLTAARMIDLYIDEELSYAVSVYAEVMKQKITADSPRAEDGN